MTSDTPDTKKDPIGHGADTAEVAPVIETKPAGIDWAVIEARWEAQRAETRERLQSERKDLPEALRETGVEEIEACYDGYADSGNVQTIAVTPDSVQLGDLESRLADFVWGMAYDLHPGFEINDGGEGTLTWNVVEDRIGVDHADFYTARNEYLHEDI